tara:strand:- start:80 stop:391 length:312 start_codon:yes stop_codon:yes gene_type:complete
MKEKLIRDFVRECLSRIDESGKKKKKKKKKKKSKNKSVAGSQPDESYEKATVKALHLDKPFNVGGWPKGRYQGWTAGPPVNVQIKNYFKKMGLLEYLDTWDES